MLTSEFGFLYVLAIMAALILLLRFLHKNIDKLWVRVLYLPFGPKTDVKYMTRSELFKSASSFLICGVYLAALWFFTILLTSPIYKNTEPGPIIFALICFIIPIICAVFFCAAFYLFIRAIFRSKNYLAPNCTLIRDHFVSNNHIKKAVERFRPQNWERKHWTPLSVLIKRRAFLKDIIVYTGQDYDPDEYELKENYYPLDNCMLCSCEIFESDDPSTSDAYTNGKEWLCTECYEKFIQTPDPQEVPA